MSIDEYWANHGKAFDPTLSEKEMEELLDWWLLYKSKASSKNYGRIPPTANEAISHLQEKLRRMKNTGQTETQHTTNVTTNNVTVSGPFSGVLQTGQNNQANSNTASPSISKTDSVKKWIFDHIGKIIVGVVVALILGWLGLGGHS